MVVGCKNLPILAIFVFVFTKENFALAQTQFAGVSTAKMVMVVELNSELNLMTHLFFPLKKKVRNLTPRSLGWKKRERDKDCAPLP